MQIRRGVLFLVNIGVPLFVGVMSVQPETAVVRAEASCSQCGGRRIAVEPVAVVGVRRRADRGRRFRCETLSPGLLGPIFLAVTLIVTAARVDGLGGNARKPP
ncbi:MAG TPA: hypothetical protein VGJ20_36525 [Xanthobacteraceae bacterium]|jgi:hypothetical protein